MDSVRTETISAFNEQVDKICKDSVGIKTNVSLVVFNDKVETVFHNEPVKTLTKLTPATYTPSGYTAMYDAVGDTLDKLEALKDVNKDNVAFLVLVISDGAENASRRHSQRSVAERIQKLSNTNRWTFSYLGANQDMSAIAIDLNIPIQNTASFSATKHGLAVASATTSCAIGSYYGVLNAGGSMTRGFYSGGPVAVPPPPQDPVATPPDPKDPTSNTTGSTVK